MDVESQHENCPLCGSIRLTDKWFVSGYTITTCNGCSGWFVRNLITKGYLENYYNDLEAGTVYTSENRENLDYYYRKLVDKINIVKNEEPKGAILDVGCTSGYFPEHMEGWERYGVEISKKHAEEAKKKVGDSIFLGLIENYPRSEKRFDVITFQDSFDHLADPYHTLRRSYNLMKPGGLVVIKVHNISCLYAKLMGSRFYAILPPLHLFYFNEKALKLLLKRAGFHYVETHFIGHKLALEIVLFRLSLSGQNKLFYFLYKLIKGTKIGRISIYKQLNDIITVFAVKELTI